MRHETRNVVLKKDAFILQAVSHELRLSSRQIIKNSYTWLHRLVQTFFLGTSPHAAAVQCAVLILLCTKCKNIYHWPSQGIFILKTTFIKFSFKISQDTVKQLWNILNWLCPDPATALHLCCSSNCSKHAVWLHDSSWLLHSHYF